MPALPASRLLALALVVSLVPSVTLPTPVRAEEETKASDDAAPKVTTLSGVVEAAHAVEIVADTEQIESLVVKQIVPHGSKVHKGQSLVSFEREEIDKRIRDAERDLRLSKLTLAGEEFDYEQFRKAQELDRAAAERDRKAARQAYDNFVDVDRDRQAESATFNLKQARASLENTEEELKQLEQMYKEDDLTEESEEIVLKRARQAVESAKFRFESTEIQTDRTIHQEIPLASANQDEALARAELAYRKAIQALNLARQKRDVEMAQKRDKFKQEEKKVAELKEERKRTSLSSPINGLVLHGALNRGRLGDKPSTLEAKAKVTANQVLLTVVDPTRLQIRIDLDEQHLDLVREGTKCQVSFKAVPDRKVAGKVQSVSRLPYAANKYDCVVALADGKAPVGVLPTMSCDLEFAAAPAGAEEKAAKAAKHKQPAKKQQKQPVKEQKQPAKDQKQPAKQTDDPKQKGN